MSDTIAELRLRACKVRSSIVRAGFNGSPAHFGSSLSCVDLLVALYAALSDKDTFILSKGHAALALYATLAAFNKLDPDWEDSFNRDGSLFCSHHGYHPELGLNMVNGSLGLGLSFGIGKALSRQRAGTEGRVFVLCGNGELNEGSALEALMFAGAQELSNFCLILDDNALQLDGDSQKVLPVKDYAALLMSLGFEVRECDGHDLRTLNGIYASCPDRALAVVAHSVKGKGVSFMEGNPHWHHAKLSPEERDAALKEIEEASHAL